MARNEVLTIKVSAEEKEAIKEAARRNRRTYSDWSRLILDEGVRAQKAKETTEEARKAQVSAAEVEEPAGEKVACGAL